MIGDFYEGSDLKLKIELEGMEFNQASDYYKIDLYNNDKKLTYTRADMKDDGEGNYYLPIQYDQIESGSLVLVITAEVEDVDFPNGKRREVLKPINICTIKKVAR